MSSSSLDSPGSLSEWCSLSAFEETSALFPRLPGSMPATPEVEVAPHLHLEDGKRTGVRTDDRPNADNPDGPPSPLCSPKSSSSDPPPESRLVPPSLRTAMALAVAMVRPEEEVVAPQSSSIVPALLAPLSEPTPPISPRKQSSTIVVGSEIGTFFFSKRYVLSGFRTHTLNLDFWL